MKRLLTLLIASIAIAVTGAAPKVATSYVTKSGSIVMLFVGTDPNIAPVGPSYITNVASNPNISVNGQLVTCQGPLWSSVSHQLPWVAYQLPSAVKSTDKVTWTAAQGWLSTSQGLIGADSGTVANYAGQLEPGVFGYQAFSDSTMTVKVGFNGAGGYTGQFSFLKNGIHRASAPLFAASVSADGYPLTIGPQGYTLLMVWKTDNNNGVDANGFPCPQGTWTLYADETAPATPMGVALNCGNDVPGPRQPTGMVATPGQLRGGVEHDKRWTWNVITPGPLLNMWLSVEIATPTRKAGPNTLTNLRLYEPGNAPVLDPGLHTNDNFVRMASPASWAFPAVVRFMEASAGSDGASSLVTDTDLTPVGEFSPGQIARASTDWPVNAPTFRGDRYVHVNAVRPYILRTSPNVYFAQQYGRCVPSDATFAPFQWQPATWGLDYDWLSATPTVASTGAVVELLTGDVAGNAQPHNLSSGQFLTLGALPVIAVASPNGAGTAIPSNGMVWVTGPSSFVMNWTSKGIAPSTRFATATAKTPVNSDALFTVGNGGRAMPPEAIAAASRSLGNTGLWVAVNHAMNDSGVLAMATRLFNATARGTPVYVQFSNEITIPNSQYGWPFHLGAVEGLTQVQAIVQRTAEVQAIFTRVWGDDAGSLVKVFQNWTVQPAAITQAFQYAQAKGFIFDAVAFSGYVDMDYSPSFTMAAASISADDARSIANPANGGAGVLMPMAAYLDLYRHHIKYNASYNGPTGYVAQAVTALARAQYTLSSPKLLFYECGPSAAIPPAVSRLSKVVRSGLTHDVSYHPAYGDVVTAFLQFSQCPGPAGTRGIDVACIEALNGGRGFDGAGFACPDGLDGLFCALWAVYAWQGQQAGPGFNNRYWATSLGGDGAAHDMGNESPGARAYMSWILGTYKGTRK